jgi:hypothetical protein
MYYLSITGCEENLKIFSWETEENKENLSQNIIFIDTTVGSAGQG